MDPQVLARRLADVVVTTVTPFDHQDDVDLGAVARQAEALADAGIGVLVPGGNTGEFASLTPTEVTDVVEHTVAAVGDRCTVVAGVGWSSRMAAEAARRAQDVGAHAIMIHHPTHTYIHPDGIGAYYERIIAAVDLGVVLYKRGPELPDRVVAELARHDRVVGVKYAVNDCDAFARLSSTVGEHATLLCGTAERWAPFFALAGAAGFTSGLANVRPDLALQLRDRLRDGAMAEAMALRARVAPFEDLRQRHGSGNNVPVVKEALRWLGRDTGRVRDPLVPLSPPDRNELETILRAWGMEESS